MSSVTKRISEIKQPRGGYVKPSLFNVYSFDDGYTLCEDENVHATVVGMAVDYLTRFAMGAKVTDAFKISCEGAFIAESLFQKEGTLEKVEKLLSGVKKIDDEAIINACKLVTFDVWLRNPFGAMMAKGADETNPDRNTVDNIRIMIERSIVFWNKYGPIVQDGFTFKPNGYTQTVDSGDGDYLTADTLWDFKVSKAKPTNKHTLQLLMYWIMGQHSGQEIFKSIDKLGIFNPRLNTVYLLDMKIIAQETIDEIERDVICY